MSRTFHSMPVAGRRLAAAAILCALALPPAARAADSRDDCMGTIDSVPATVNAPGIYCLGRNLSTAMASGVAISVSSNVTLDCKGFQLSGSAGAATNAVGVSASTTDGVTVRNCTIRGFLRGIEFTHINNEGHGHLVEDNLLDANTQSGIRLIAHSATVRRNRVRNTGGSTVQSTAHGIQVTGPGVQVLDNSVVDVRASDDSGQAYGILAGFSLVRGNRVSTVVPGTAQPGLGIRTTALAVDNQVSGVMGGASIGIDCSGAAIGNTILGSAVPLDAGCPDYGNVVVP